MKHKGFTLVELLVSIAVLGILSGIVIAAINPAQHVARARDAGRKADVLQIAEALDAYRAAYGSYPSPCDRTDSEGGCAGATDWRNAGVLVSSGVMKGLPDDPTNNSFVSVWQGTGNYSYFVVSENAGGGTAGQYYMVGAFLENTNDPETIGNLSSRPKWPNCTGDIGFSANIYMRRSYHCDADPPGAL